MPIGEDPAAHGHWCIFIDFYHTMPYHAGERAIYQITLPVRQGCFRLQPRRGCGATLYQVVKTAGLNLLSFHYLYVCAKPDWYNATVGLTSFRLEVSGCLTTGYWIKGGSPRILASGHIRAAGYVLLNP